MPEDSRPAGGLHAGTALRPWGWLPGPRLRSARLRCKRDQYYFLRAVPGAGQAADRGLAVQVRFWAGPEPLAEQSLLLEPRGAGRAEYCGWLGSPARTTHLELELSGAARAACLSELHLHAVAERDPKCHPLANVPRWSTLTPPFAIERVFLPESLAVLGEHLPDLRVEVVRSPGRVGRFADEIARSACVLDPEWVLRGDWTLADVERLAERAWVLIDLGILARLLGRAGAAETEARQYHASHEIMSARVEYSDVPTRGFGLQDVFPYCALDERGRYTVRVLRTTRSWKKYASAAGFATLLSSETPWVHRGGDVLAAARAVGQGELLASDAPWLLLGGFGAPAAPRLLAHLLRMHLGAPCADHLQHWNTWDDVRVLVRDIAELRRFTPLRPVRWQPEQRLARFGLSVVPPEVRRGLMIRTGRIDARAPHDGLRPEPMMIFMKWLAREVRERTPWARKYAQDALITWQFDAGDAVYYATGFDSAALLPAVPAAADVLRVRSADAGPDTAANGTQTLALPGASGGIFGDGSLQFQDVLTRRLRRWIESRA